MGGCGEAADRYVGVLAMDLWIVELVFCAGVWRQDFGLQ